MSDDRCDNYDCRLCYRVGDVSAAIIDPAMSGEMQGGAEKPIDKYIGARLLASRALTIIFFACFVWSVL